MERLSKYGECCEVLEICHLGKILFVRISIAMLSTLLYLPTYVPSYRLPTLPTLVVFPKFVLVFRCVVILHKATLDSHINIDYKPE
jgi:hypothetical protein